MEDSEPPMCCTGINAAKDVESIETTETKQNLTWKAHLSSWVSWQGYKSQLDWRLFGSVDVTSPTQL